MSLEVYLPLKLWKSLGRIGVSSLSFWWNSAVKLSDPGLLFIERFMITVSISVLVKGLQKFSISSWFSSGRLHFSKNPFIFSPSCLFLLAFSV